MTFEPIAPLGGAIFFLVVALAFISIPNRSFTYATAIFEIFPCPLSSLSSPAKAPMIWSGCWRSA